MQNEQENENVINMDEVIDDVEFEETDSEGVATSDKDKIKKLREEIKELQAKNKEYLDGWQRARADLVNKEKQLISDRVEMIKRAGERIAENLIPVLDSYEMARKNVTAWESVDSKWRVGIEYIFSQLENVLTGEGMKNFAPKVGDALDIMTMQAVGDIETDDDTKDHTVAEVIQSGYYLGERMLREAKVKVFVKK